MVMQTRTIADRTMAMSGRTIIEAIIRQEQKEVVITVLTIMVIATVIPAAV
jgi:hypothetical protein